MKLRNPFKLCSPKTSTTKKSARQIRQEKIDNYYAAHSSAPYDTNKAVSPVSDALPRSLFIEKSESVDNPETAKTTDHALVASFPEEKKDGEESKESTTGAVERMTKTNTVAALVAQQTTSDGGASHDEAENKEKAESGDVSGIHESSSPLCGACGCF